MTTKTSKKQRTPSDAKPRGGRKLEYYNHTDYFSAARREARKRTSLRSQFTGISLLKNRALRHEEWIVERLRFAAIMLRDSVTIDAEIRGGVPVLKGTRVPVAQVLAEIADNATVSEIADDLDLEQEVIVKLLEGMAIHLDRPFFR